MHTPKKLKLCYLISDIYSSDVLENTIIKLSNFFHINVVLINKDLKNSKIKEVLLNHNILFIEYIYKNKFDLFKILFKVLYLLWKNKYDIIHCHLFEATILGLIAGKIAGVKKRIYTRHHSTYHHIYFPKAVKFDLLSNKLATHIVSISVATYETLSKMEKVNPKKIFTIYHPFNTKHIQNNVSENSDYIYTKWNIPPNKYIVLCIARYVEWKGLQYIIPAFAQFLKHYPDSFLLIANAYGPFRHTIKELLSKLPPDSYREISFEENIYALYKISKVFIHTPIDPLCEAFGQVYIESLITQTPSIITLSGIAREIALHKHNFYIVPFKDSSAIFNGLIELRTNTQLVNTLKNNSKEYISLFDIDNIIPKYIELYNK
ncbi:MAG: glycosyltransferase family 4 protein [Bacteroidota bacterium]